MDPMCRCSNKRASKLSEEVSEFELPILSTRPTSNVSVVSLESKMRYRIVAGLVNLKPDNVGQYQHPFVAPEVSAETLNFVFRLHPMYTAGQSRPDRASTDSAAGYCEQSMYSHLPNRAPEPLGQPATRGSGPRRSFRSASG